MAFLGILNLNNEDQVRPEEQASVIQVKTKHCSFVTLHNVCSIVILSIIITAGYLRCSENAYNSIAKTSFG